MMLEDTLEIWLLSRSKDIPWLLVLLLGDILAALGQTEVGGGGGGGGGSRELMTWGY